MDIIMLMAAFIMLAGVAVLFCNLLHLNPAEGMLLAVLIVIAADALTLGLTGSFISAVVIIALLSAGGLGISGYRWYKDGRISFQFLLSPYFITLTLVFIISLLIYYGDTIQNIEELGLWVLADKYMCTHDSFYSHNSMAYIQGSNLFRYFFLRIAGFQEGTVYTVNGLLYWIGLLLPFGKITKKNSPRLLLYVLLMHVGLYSMYYYGSKCCSPELALACWTGGLAGWWITREKKKTDIIVLLAGLLTAFTFTETINVALIFFVIILAVVEMFGAFIRKGCEQDMEDRYLNVKNEKADPEAEKDDSERISSFWSSPEKIDFCFLMAGIFILAGIVFLYANLSRFTYLQDNMTYFLRCLVENNMTLWKSDLNHTFLFNFILTIVLLVIVIDRRYQRNLAVRYIIYSSIITAIYIPVLIFGMVNAEYQEKDKYLVDIQRLIALLTIFLLVMGLSWLFCEKRMLEKKTPYIPGLILLVVFLYGVNNAYLTNTTAAYPEKNKYYSTIKQVQRECEYIQDQLSPDKKLYMINQGEEIASAEARFILGDQVSDYSSQTWKFSVNGGMVADQVAPYESVSKLPAVLTSDKYRYVWIYKTNTYLINNLPKVMGDEMEDPGKTSEKAKSKESKIILTGKTAAAAEKRKIAREEARAAAWDKTVSEMVSGQSLAGGQIYKVMYYKKKATGLKLVKNILPYETRKIYYRWNDIIVD